MQNRSRKEKLNIIKKYYPGIYNVLENKLPNLVKDPDNVSMDELLEYNRILAHHSGIILSIFF